MSHYDFSGSLSTMARERLESSAIGEMIKLVIQHEAISFAAGEPSMDLLPIAQLKEAFSCVFDDPAKFGYYWSDLGYIELRQWIAQWMHGDGLVPSWVTPDNIMMTCGSQEGISLVGEALIDPGSLVVVESPTYMETLLTFRKQGATCIGVSVDEDGIVPGHLERILQEKKVRLLYSIPNYQNPTGYTATAERRKQVLDILRKHDIPIVEDDPYHYLSYEGAPPVSYMRLSGDDQRVVYLGSFSKIIAPGVRCGWMVVPDTLLDKIVSLRVNSCLGLPIMVQCGLHQMLSGMDMNAHLDVLRSAYRAKRDGMLAALDERLAGSGLSYNRPAGGFFIWGKLDGIADMFDFARYAVVKEKIGIVPGSVFFVSGCEDHSSIRFSFAKVNGAQAQEGTMRLARAIKSYIGR